jgi:hypothetical protein
MEEIELDNIRPSRGISNTDWLVDVTRKIAAFALEYYKDKLDPTISYSCGGKVNVCWNPRKNSCVGTCRRIQRIIQYNELKINTMDMANVLGVAVHECSHLICDGHGKDFMEIQDFLFDKCIEKLKEGRS